MASKKRKTSRASAQAAAAVAAPIIDASLSEETQRRYLHYALSVITARALPDVRDGLKPVQRRILYTMYNDMHLRHDAKYRKCAAIVGDVMGKYHPHGDSAIYDALVRMAQSFSLRTPLVDGRGNFGSADGDSAAAMRYTEAKLQKVSTELIAELGKRTVAFRPNYDGTRFEPVVLPARFPNLLVNGVQGIAVGMATSIPPHNFGEVIDATVALIDNPDLTVKDALKHIKGPDFPTAGQLLSSRKDLEVVYTEGSGSLKLRGEWKSENGEKNEQLVVVTSIPYAVKRASVVEKIADVIIARKMPALLDVRDESTHETRIVLEIKKGTDPQLVMAYLYKHTPLLTNVTVDLTCLVPTDNPEIAGPARLDLVEILRHFLDFRMEVVGKRLKFELDEQNKRIHILEGLETAFDVLDETIRIIRASKGKKDAAEQLMERFEFDEIQVEAILELKLYRLAQLEILVIRKELKERRAEAKRLAKLLGNEGARFALIRAELGELKAEYGQPRETRIVGKLVEPTFDADAFILDEDAHVLITRQGWIKRQREVKDVTSTRVRDGDAVLDVIAGSTKATIALFSNLGACYVARIVDVPATTGYGSPVQQMFKLADGERIVRMIGLDPRLLSVPAPTEDAEEPEPPFVVAVTKKGMTLRTSLRGHRDPSTRSGRKYIRVAADDEVITIEHCADSDHIACATEAGKALVCEASQVSLLSGPGKGVMLIKLDKGDQLVGAAVLTRPSDALVLEKDSNTQFTVTTRKYQSVSRGGKGHALFKRGKLKRMVIALPIVPPLPSITGADR